jgi:hypothetical protein
MNIQDIELKPCEDGLGEQARVHFPNGWGASIITGSMFYSRPGTPWEIAVIDKDQNIRYDSGLTDGVFGYLSDAEATKVLDDVEALTLPVPDPKACVVCGKALIGKSDETDRCWPCLLAEFKEVS